ncbi:MAG: pyruvate dehydrogenase complex dihydrolipoamide acetyltransferase [Sphingobacteriia bacterium 24-36-13]|jgi:pyruvate dehydrogenase E2 component (dihydrolipoamide acetyltransferase)|uniref:pyruvate dehydrogenase complex dihydrolipoamide acetyltransferase n=1 Tax=Sediminibacterium sp. TaxID=1917865 RepID=UPI000BCBB78F|nr:pyruvate dehydrogenase complex dihydrolipoamide acetyltransferase [Sediminibacterium sp.]OYY10719.1 MAG: pyruvate dehydrogenase complex dihydrolipoamide acetyltransferase [Sphingobacteriia bacterium 35-36-14]OYZ54062.1 MAG: pyruvate dehydrogenase complex dihydrolipoamide acetyltransferase [Sphingobacteriia bacterium 24-36-13]OZA65307.1 MAG: pyruvate dehydrogenase complex dihydrolipoamide acetyltransferase [Sphingobacteriia bacterium 39-36-14]HQS24205.1 pyruvate dehydrogenase complex dihydrol
MAEVILMPRLSDTMTEGVIAAWHKRVGDTVQKGDLLAEIETDKATMELESYQDGVLLHIGTPDGGKLQVNDLLAIFGKPGEDITELVKIHGSGALAPIPTAAPVAPVETAAPATAPIPTETTTSMDISSMDEVVLMPRLSDTMTEGVIASWQKNVGDIVKKGEVLADIETDKATMELESYKDGVLLYQGAQAGEKILVNDLLCIIGKEGLDVAAIVAAVKAGTGAKTPSEEAPAAPSVVAPSAPAVTAAPAVEQAVVNSGRIFASPLAKRIAAEKGIDLKYVKGSGDNGRITKIDIDQYVPSTILAAAAPAAKSAAPVISNAVAGQVSFTDVPVSQMRKVIAKRLSESLFTAPHFYLTMQIDMDAAIAARTKINEVASVKVSFNDLVVKATAMALKKHPKINSSWMGDFIRYNDHINIGVAVAVDEGLLVPVVRFADGKSLSQIGAEVKDFAQRAKDKKLQPSDWEGSTFTISNLGMFGIDQFTAIINPPDACILAVGGISQEPVVKNGQVVPGNIMKLTLSCDHRVVDGATGAAFLQTLKQLLEEPVRMLV